jgi:predicted anti-sigma-YlaC factor YlaD
VSARIDGEPPGIPEAEVDAHLAACTACRHWATSAERLTRRLRLAPAEAIPDLSGMVVSTVMRGNQHRRWSRRLTTLRIALAVVAVTQAALTLSIGIAGDLFDTPLHVNREAGAWNLALASGLLAVAWQTRRAAGVLPLLATAVVMIFGFELLDLARKHTGLAALLPHLLLVVALALVVMLARMSPPSGGGYVALPPSITAADSDSSTLSEGEPPSWAGGPAATATKRYVA